MCAAVEGVDLLEGGGRNMESWLLRCAYCSILLLREAESSPTPPPALLMVSACLFSCFEVEVVARALSLLATEPW